MKPHFLSVLRDSVNVLFKQDVDVGLSTTMDYLILSFNAVSDLERNTVIRVWELRENTDKGF